MDVLASTQLCRKMLFPTVHSDSGSTVGLKPGTLQMKLNSDMCRKIIRKEMKEEIMNT